MDAPFDKLRAHRAHTQSMSWLTLRAHKAAALG
jgi:hypothetical protein